MKRILLFVLVVIMLAGTATVHAQTRECMIIIEGYEEIITETLYESPQGFRIWYPADIFAVTHEDGNDYIDSVDGIIDMCVAIVDGRMSYEAADEMMDADIEMSIANGAEILGEIETWTLDSGMTVKHVDIAYNDEYNPIYYLYGSGRVFCISCHYPAEAAEGFGARIEQMISSFELIPE